jgi:hypothetical protein
MDRELRELQRALARVRRRSGQRRYSAELRSQVTSWVAKRREAGDWWCDVSRALGISADTLARWATRSTRCPRAGRVRSSKSRMREIRTSGSVGGPPTSNLTCWWAAYPDSPPRAPPLGRAPRLGSAARLRGATPPTACPSACKGRPRRDAARAGPGRVPRC